VDELTPEVQAAIKLLRSKGFALAVFTVSELEDVEPKYIQDAMVSAGWEAIENLKGQTV
jgi:hypothetical protein